MPTELIKRTNWDLQYPAFTYRCLDLAAACRKRGADYFAISGYRSFKKQGDLHAQGRTKPGKIVTNATPGFSAHNYGVAEDWCKDKDATRAGLQPDWNLSEYVILAEEAVKLGLEAAYYWKSFKEGPHVQLPLEAKGIKFAELKTIHDKEGIQAVWKRLDKIKW